MKLLSGKINMSILVIDLKGVDVNNLSDITTQKVISELKKAAMHSGFFYIKNHGVPIDMVEQQFKLAKELLSLSEIIKQKYDVRNYFGFRGFDKLNGQQLDPYGKPDYKEGFYCGKNYPQDHPFAIAKYQNYGPNQWPEQVPQCEEICQKYIDEMYKLSDFLMQLLALTLSLPANYFDSSSQDPMGTLRMVRYPPIPEGADESLYGVGAHTDWGSVTILAQDQIGGLEVCMPDGKWVEATPIEGTFVVNLGDMIPKWTNGLYHSNPHRVKNCYSKNQYRYSIPFFYEPDYHAIISPVPGTLRDGEIPKFQPCTVGDHLEEMYKRSYKKAEENAVA